MQVIQISDFAHYPDFTHDFERNFFNEPPYLISKSENFWQYFCLIENKIVLARIVFFVQNNVAINPHHATFGGIESSEKLSDEDLLSFLKNIIESFQNTGIEAISILSWPSFLNPSLHQQQEMALKATGFDVLYIDQNHFLKIDETPFTNKIHLSEKRRLKKAKRLNLSFSFLDASYIDTFYELLTAARKRKNYTVSSTKTEIIKLLTFQEVKLCGVFDGEILIAACILTQQNQRSVYYFLPADHPDYLQTSPMVFLIANIYEYCQAQKIEFFDLGISSVSGRFPFGKNLAIFKERCGAESSEKKCYQIDLTKTDLSF